MSGDSAEPGSTRAGPWYRHLLQPLIRKILDRGELVQMLRAAERSHIIDPDSLAMMEGVLNVLELRVRDIMIPRSEMVVLNEGEDPQSWLPVVIESGHSRFPLLDTRRDQVAGILLAKDLLAYLAQGERFRVKDVVRPAVFVPESKRLNILLREFRTSRNHMAIVVDEYGGTAGLVSIEDVLEQIVGDIDDEHDVSEESDVRPHGRNRYTVRARMAIDEFNEYFGTAFDDTEFDTIGGVVMKEFGHLPVRGEQLELGGLNFKVLRADERRMHTLRVIGVAAPDAAADADA